MIRRSLKEFAGKVLSTEICEKFCAQAALQHQYRSLLATQEYEKKEDLWDFAINKCGAEKRLLFLEFGVWRGYSMSYFSKGFRNGDSRFIGCDSFEGLPEKWGSSPVRTFTTDGNIPRTNDTRVTFVKGWFQNTFDHTIKLAREMVPLPEELLIHFDADIYSSTLFLLSRLYNEFERYYFIFDEFTGHETRALLNFQQAYGVNVEFFCHRNEVFPQQVFGRLDNMKGKYQP